MSDKCDQNCGGCGEECGDRQTPRTDFMEKPHELSNIKKVIGIVSGKGGVGKSLITSLMAVAMRKQGKQVAILDADITGPSIPKAFGVTNKLQHSELGLMPAKSSGGINIMSINLLLENDSDPVIWRGPMVGNTVKQFWTDVIWGDIDYMFIDMPPGTGDVPLTVFQSIKVDGIIVVTSPQELVAMIVGKAVKMAQMMKIPIIGLVENMAYFKCPECGRETKNFGESHLDETAREHQLEILSRIPIDPAIAKACDAGQIETISTEHLNLAVETIMSGQTNRR